MKDQHQTALERFNAIDQMINEGLSSGSINPKYTEAHLKLKEKQEAQSLSSESDERLEKKNDNK